MLEEGKSKVVNNPQVIREEIARENISNAPKKSKKWIFKFIFILILVGLIYYFFKNPDSIRNIVNRFFEGLLS